MTAPFEGTAYLTFGPCCLPNQSTGEIAHAAFKVTSQTLADVLLFENLTLPPSHYYLTLAGARPEAGYWVVASPFSVINTGLGTAIAGGDVVAPGITSNPQYPPASRFLPEFGGRQTQFAVRDNLPEVPEPSTAFLLAAGAAGLLILRRQRPSR